MGIDPGTSIMGYSLIRIESGKAILIDMGLVKMKHIQDPYLKLKEIFSQTTLLIDTHHPDELAIEAPFFGKNVQSMLKLGRAQGAAIAAALQRNIPIFEYAPRKIKLAITGQGSASKEQVAGMLKSILGFKEAPDALDATDALATAMCHYYQRQLPETGNYRGWGDFVKKNPARKA
ncbi:MAG: crossover junction endodeoxyribonuclease RuvC [Bacteroidota bacterium]|nr:MAG: crossover junction endodeoxyribonuclease RuvC [Bacteroidota bacterium]